VSLEERAARERSLERAAAAVAACRMCEIGNVRQNSVYGEGDPCAALMIVGEGPGETEDKLGRPFVGRAGELLEKMLGAIGFSREDAFICNTVKCRPTAFENGRLRNRPPDPQEMRNCRPYLDEQIDLIRPRVILALGAPAARSFLGAQFSITRQRGQWFEGPAGIPLIATFHPAYLLRMTGGELNAVKRLVWEDLKQVRDKLAQPPLAPPPPEITQSSLFE
jgi:uracil-DNA glycosylase